MRDVFCFLSLGMVVSLGWVYFVIEGVHRVVTECDFI